MLRYFRQLDQRAQELGNHRRKYTHAIEKHGRDLIDRLETSGSFDRVHLRQPALDLASEMDAVLAVGQGEKEKLELLGCYYAVQFLHMNIRNLDLLWLNARGAKDPLAVYKEFIRRASEDFGELVSEYLKRLMDLFLPEDSRPEFVICTVGTRLHQDDVDLGIIDDGSKTRHDLNKAIGRMARQMMRWTSVPDFYLSEHVGSEGYTVSIAEYRSRLDRRILDFVSVTEILSVYPIVGSTDLFERFKREIHNRYYYRRKKTIREHEGYLRGLAGEIESLLLWPHDPKRINPKEDLLRLVSAVMGAQRTIHRIREPELWNALEKLRDTQKRQKNLFDSLERSYSFVETTRHLYQQFSAQEEEIDLNDPKEQQCLQQVAHTMGYEDVGVIHAWEQLVVHYIEHVKRGRDAVRALTPDIADHIRKVTIFSEWMNAMPGQIDPRQNLAIDFLRRVRYFQGIKYWDDLLEALEKDENGLLERFVHDLKCLDETHCEQIIRYYAHWGYQTFYTLFRLLTILGVNARKYGADDVFRALNRAFVETIKGSADEIRRFSTVFVHYPDLVYRYLTIADEATLDFLHDKLSGDVWDSQVAAWRESLCRLCDIIRKASRYFRRVIDRVCDRHPEYLLYFGDLGRLDQIAKGILADLIRVPSYDAQKEMLGLYYDVQYLRIGLATLQGQPLGQLDVEFTEVADGFLEILYDICKAEVDAEEGRRILTHDLLAIFVAGGHARERAHQDDYDLVVLLNSDSEEIYEYSNRIVAKLNREISRRGIMPQYRLADRFGGFVTRFSELETFLQHPDDDSYVEMSQLIGARLIVGSSRLENEFIERIIRKGIYARKNLYTRALIGEIQSRHSYASSRGDGAEFNIKEGRGGLRDLEMGMLIWKTLYEMRAPIGGRFWDKLAEHNPGQRWEFMELKESYRFLNRLRDVYRLSVAPLNRLDPIHFDRPAELLGYRDGAGEHAGAKLLEDYRKHTSRVAGSLEKLLKFLTKT